MEQVLELYKTLYLEDKVWLVFALLVMLSTLILGNRISKVIPLKEYPEIAKSKRYSGSKIVLLLSLVVMMYPLKYAVVVGSMLYVATQGFRYLILQKHLPDMLLKGVDRELVVKKPELLISKKGLRDVSEVIYQMMQLGRSLTLVVARGSDLGAVISTGIPLGDMVISKNNLLGVYKGFDGRNLVIVDNKLVSVGVELPNVVVQDYEGLEEADQDLGGIVGITQIYDCVGIYVSGSTSKLSVVGNYKGKLRTYLGLSALEKDLREGVTDEDIENILKQLLNVSAKDVNILDKQLPKPKTKKEKKKEIQDKDLEIRIQEVERERAKQLGSKKTKERSKRK